MKRSFITLISAGLILAACGGDDSVEPEVSIVLSAIEARNGGDIDAYKGSLTGASLRFEERVHLAEAFTHANAITELSDCRVAEDAPSGDSVVDCESTSTDDFYGAGGIMQSGIMTFRVTEDGKISDITEERDTGPWEETELAMFNSAFWSWLREAHPAVFDDIAFARGNLDSIPGLSFGGDPHSPDEMGIAVQHVEEFVAQSDAYPINQ